MIRLGITGGIGSGKSTVCRALEKRGIAVYDSDARAKMLMNTVLCQSIEQLFGKEAYLNGELNRAYISSKVFSNRTLLDALNAIVHPAVGVDFEQWAAEQQCLIVALESAILFESGFNSRVDAVLFVDAPLELRITRTMARDGRSRADVEARIANQRCDEARLKSDFIINNGADNNLEVQIDQLLTSISDYAAKSR